MGSTVQARLDDEAESALHQVATIEGWTTSEVIRQCILEAAERRARQARPRLIGAGCFDSDIADSATHEKGMEGFGKKWRVDKEGNGRWDW
jgi:predicted transcriptional regulator